MSMFNLLLYYEEFHIFFTVVQLLRVFINSRNEQLLAGVMAELVEHYSSIAEVSVHNHFQDQNFQTFLFNVTKGALNLAD